MNAEPPKKNWPETSPYNDAIDAFDKALTRAGWDEAFRKRLSDSPASAKAAVAEIGEINIPDDRVIVFYEPQGPKPPVADKKTGAAMFNRERASDSQSSENVHVFYLPPLTPDDQSKKYTYEQFFMCCYDMWIRT